MPNKVSKHKQRISLLISKDLLAAVDVAAKREGMSRTEYVTRALSEAVEPRQEPPSPATASQIEEMQAIMYGIASEISHTRTLAAQLVEDRKALPANRRLTWRERISGQADA